MALLDSKQLNPRLTGSFTLSGSMVGDSASSGSLGRLEVFGDSNLIGNLTLGGNITIGDSSVDAITITADFTSNLNPNLTSTYDLGNAAKSWQKGYIEELYPTTITATGNVSSSATSTGSFGELHIADKVGIGTTAPDYALDVAGNAGFNEYIYHNGEADTYIQFAADELNFVVGAANMIYLNEGGAGAQADKITINNDLADVDFQVKGDSEANLIRTEASTDRVGIGTSTPDSTFHVLGTISGSDYGGNISGSSTSTGSFGRVSTDDSIYASGRIYEAGSSVIDHATAMAIVFGG